MHARSRAERRRHKVARNEADGRIERRGVRVGDDRELPIATGPRRLNGVRDERARHPTAPKTRVDKEVVQLEPAVKARNHGREPHDRSRGLAAGLREARQAIGDSVAREDEVLGMGE